jgi:energy-coupling factor transporter ATP-binding protein EcfA2
MILQKLEVDGFRCFDAMVTLVLDPHKINILHGNNGAGKSSLFSALLRGLLDSHKVGGKGMAELCPWGTQLSPRITVVFEHDGQEYRVCKTFLRQKGTRLERKDGKTFRPFANNEQADEKLRELLLAGAAGTGLAKAEGWGLAQALWCAHDQLAISKLQGQALSSVHEILGAQSMSPDSMKLIGAVKERYLEYFAESGKVRGGKKAPVWVSKEQDATRLKSKLFEATDKLERLHSAQMQSQELQQ